MDLIKIGDKVRIKRKEELPEHSEYHSTRIEEQYYEGVFIVKEIDTENQFPIRLEIRENSIKGYLQSELVKISDNFTFSL